ncbi:MAG TPA: HAMP domain-containing sensor histidine kinase [Burkholderiaceae bacterium]|nr:HAMP domain-containing sensor histidine kinase [Burkholderiaceae bacterium]
MKNLYLRIYVTVVVVLLLFAAASGWVFQRHMEQERVRAEAVLTERMGAWAELIERSLPGQDQPAADQAAALLEWSQRLRLPLALDSDKGVRIAQSESFARRQTEGGPVRGLAVRLDDGRTLWIMRPGLRQGGGRLGLGGPPPGARPGGPDGPGGPPPFLPFVPPAWQQGLGLVVVLVILFIAVAAGAYPVVRRLTRRLEALKLGVEQFGAGQLSHRVQVTGHDEVAAVASSFNVAAARVEALVRSHQSLLANASHELRSPLARMKMAVSMLEDAPPLQRALLKKEIDTNVGELDALVEEVLLASRLDAAATPERQERVELLGMAAEEAARVDAAVDGAPTTVLGEDRLIRRALRNLLENARRYGGGEVEVIVGVSGGRAEVRVCDRGPGVPEAMRERIFEPFFRLPGHAEQAGGVGLGLSLVKQIAERHGGSVRCEARAGGGSCFVLALPLA